tara:strand:+ start:2702 stop:3139 length:438 start_codon:yes stop_codon:yes gene_type:complete
MTWFSVLKNEKFDKEHNLNELRELENMFNSNQQKAIGYIPISWSSEIEEEIKNTASRLGLQYKKYDERGSPKRPDGNSFSNGGHFMWDAEEIEQYLTDTEFSSVQELIDFVAYNSYIGKPYRRIIDGLFGTPNVKLGIENKRNNK